MDIKVLLLESLQLKKPICGTHRIYYGKSFFVIKYILNGKILTVKSIKNKRKRKTWAQRIRCYYRAYKMYCSKENKKDRNIANTTKRNFEDKATLTNQQLEDKITQTIRNLEDKETRTDDVQTHTKEVQTETLKTSPKVKNSSTETICVQTHTIEVQTERLKVLTKVKEITKPAAVTKSVSFKNPVSNTSTAQQTIASARYSRLPTLNKMSTSSACQTELNTECKGIQCKRLTETKVTNTEVDMRDSTVQTQNELLCAGSSEDSNKLLAIPVKDFDVFVYMLNEIGDTVINQNQLLNNNAVMMRKIMQNNKSKKSKSLIDSCRPISTQTDQLVEIEKKNNFTQTAPICIKPKKLLLFKGRNTPHKQKI